MCLTSTSTILPFPIREWINLVSSFCYVPDFHPAKTIIKKNSNGINVILILRLTLWLLWHCLHRQLCQLPGALGIQCCVTPITLNGKECFIWLGSSSERSSTWDSSSLWESSPSATSTLECACLISRTTKYTLSSTLISRLERHVIF